MEAKLPRSLSFLTDPDRRNRYNNEFVATDLMRYAPFFDDLDDPLLSDQQRESCIRLEDSNLLIASAGSGKSATMVGKVAYVLEKRLYQPEEILVPAYNRTAAEELKERIAHQLGLQPADLQCKVTTFHALGRGIIELVEARPPQLANWVDHPAGEARVIAKIIEDLMQSNAGFAKVWIELLVLYPKADIPASVFDSDADYDRYISARRGGGEASIGAFGAIYVRSLQEQTIANWLWLNKVEFQYERQVATQDEDGTIRHVHPDFNPLDVKLASGRMSALFPLVLPHTVGTDFAGVVEDVGPLATRWKKGNRVFGRCLAPAGGAFAELLAIDGRLLASVPQGLTMRLAAAFPTIAGTAWQALFEEARVGRGMHVLRRISRRR